MTRHPRTVPPRRPWSLLTVAGLVLPLLAGCGADRPDALAWSGTWTQRSEAVSALITTSDSDVMSLAPSSCGEAVTVATATRNELVPAPTGKLDTNIRAWTDLVDAVGTECAPSADQDQVLHDIGALADTIDALVASQVPTR